MERLENWAHLIRLEADATLRRHLGRKRGEVECGVAVAVMDFLLTKHYFWLPLPYPAAVLRRWARYQTTSSDSQVHGCWTNLPLMITWINMMLYLRASKHTPSRCDRAMLNSTHGH